MPIDLLTDSEACRMAVVKGSSGALRYMRKHQFVSLSLVADLFEKSTGNTIARVESAENHSDLMTKILARVLHERHCIAIGIRIR